MAERSLRFPLVSSWDGRGVNQGRRDLEKFRRDSGRTFDRAGTEHGRRYSGRLSKSLGGGFSASTGIVTRGAQLMGGALAAVGVAKLATDSVKMAATFDKTMRQTAAVAKVPQRQIKELRDVALDMGAKTSFSARQAGEAMLELGKGGLTFAQMKAGALSSTLTLAAAGGIELGEAAGYVVKGLTAFGLKADKAATVAAALAGGANASTASVEDMGLALAQVGQGARSAGLSIQETTAVLAAFSDNGIRGADAGTSLKTMLARLVPQTDKQANAMRRLGLDFTDAHGAILPVTEIAQQLQDRLKGLSQEQRIAAMNTVFGSDATRAATILMNEGSKGLAKYIKATNDRGAAEKLAKTNTEGAAGAFERLSGAIETVQIKAGDKLLPLLADAATTIADRVIPAFERWASSFRNDLEPHLGRMADAWNENKGAIIGLVTTLASSGGTMSTTGGQARTFADTLVTVTNFAGSAARALDTMGDGLNEVNRRFEVSAQDIRNEFVVPVSNDFRKLAGAVGLEWVIDDVVADFQRLSPAVDQHATTTDRAKTAGDRLVSTLRAEKEAVDALKGALKDEETSELDVRQAKINVATAQQRLTGLVKGGKKGSLEYRQAQIDLRRAQIDLEAKTDEYKTAQQKAKAATAGAMHATQQAQPPYKKFGEVAKTAGGRAYQMGKSARDGLGLIHSRRVTVSATFGFKTPPGVSVHDIVGATGGYVTPRAIVPRRLLRGGFLNGPGTETSDSIPARLSKGEYVVRAKAVRAVGRDTLDDINAQGFATGGPVLDAKFPTGSVVARVARRFEAVIDRAISRVAGRWDRYAEKEFGGTGKPAVMRFIRSADPLPYIWGGAGRGGYDCSGLVGAVHLAHLGRPYGHGQRLYTTSSIHAGVAGLKPGLGGTLQIGVTAGTGHMAGRYGGLGFEAESTRTGIKIGSAASRPEGFARRYHLARGGPVEEEFLAALAATGKFDIGGDRGKLRVNGRIFDSGGYLMPGTTVAHNRTGRPERVLAPGESTAVNLTVNIHNHGPILGSPQAFAREATAEVRSELKRQLRREGKVALASQL